MDVVENVEKNKIGYVYSTSLIEQLDKIPKIAGRARLVTSLMNSYGLFSKLKLIAPQPCDSKQLQTFHSSSYLEYLQECGRGDEENEEDTDDSEENDKSSASYYGLDHDCPVVDDLFQLCTLIGGASLTAADLLVSGEFKWMVNWFGGWHHAKRERASGYCYVNDCVLSILRLRRRFERVLYIDLDLHHGDGITRVQEAFEYTNKVCTLSFHKHSPGFFPGTGSVTEIGKGPGKYHSVNVPLLCGLDDSTLVALFSRIFTKILDVYRPEAIVLQCGADALYGDPIDTEAPFNLTLEGYLECVRLVMSAQLPTLFLGGGGYNLANTARLWTSIVAQLVGTPELIDTDIPDHDPYFLQYAPSYEMRVEPGCHRNKNTPEYTQKILDTVLGNLDMIKI